MLRQDLQWIGVVSLGCDKNRVDTENMLAYLNQEGYSFTGNPQDADIIIVNTCAFIESAKVEAIETILEMAEFKISGKCKCLIVSGCLPQRYMDEIKTDLSEVDIFIGTASYAELPSIIAEWKGERSSMANDKDKRDFTTKRYLTTPYHYAYLKIAEGCDNKCTYCAIPMIRGKYTSRKMEDIITEARGLIADYSTHELIIVAQDITRYGIDIYGEYKLVELLNKLSQEDVRWIRLLYCYPELVTEELIRLVAKNDKIVKYLDIPMQHCSSAVLKRMGRRVNKEKLEILIKKIREIDPEINIRTTFIVGFPGETPEQYEELVEFIKRYRFDKCGFFAYSAEENTPAVKLDGRLSDKVIKRRVANLYAIQEKIMAEKADEMIGKTVSAVYEDIDYDRSMFIGRMATDAPEIDRVVYMTADKPLDIGEIYQVKVMGIEAPDLIGEIITEDN